MLRKIFLLVLLFSVSALAQPNYNYSVTISNEGGSLFVTAPADFGDADSGDVTVRSKPIYFYEYDGYDTVTINYEKYQASASGKPHVTTRLVRAFSTSPGTNVSVIDTLGVDADSTDGAYQTGTIEITKENKGWYYFIENIGETTNPADVLVTTKLLFTKPE